ncbi:hypothetical protein [Mesorhizobium sp. KR9-304]|uniref:hypothetical protein n=1 Tax=Mesorhizobium sp. KR9-304 TaxID=3156614 RepID=UPI0032B4FD8E
MRRRILAAVLLTTHAMASTALADHIDPYDLAVQASETYAKNDSYAEVRALFSKALRDARHDGRLSPRFAIVYAMYSDTARFDGDPSFALQLADEGLALLTDANEPDDDVKNSLLVSRAYALADLGQYSQAVESVAITALWLGERFGDKARRDLEAVAKGWAEQAGTQPGVDTKLPAAVELATDLLDKAQDALNAQDTRTAITLASRALLPADTGMRQIDVDYLNARTHLVLGVAYFQEGRHDLSLVALRRAADLLSQEPWDGKSKAVLRAEVLNDEKSSTNAWHVFSYLSSVAQAIGAWDLCAAAIDSSEPFATTPVRRFSLLSQRSTLAFQAKNYAEAEEIMRRSEVAAVESGDELNAALARMYVGIVRLAAAFGTPTAETEGAELVRLAEKAAQAAGDDQQMVEFIYATATKTAVQTQSSNETVLPLARRGFDVFRDRQKAMAGYDTGQQASRRDRRQFLEMLIAGEYAAAEATKN